MPNYEYRCTSCENQFELWQEVGAEAPPCPECQSEVKKVFHPIRTIFKGSGFYVTDLRAEKEKSSTPAKTESKDEAAPAASTSNETKTETKTETAPAANQADSKPEAKAAPATAAPAKP